jgi:hypothetical protein
VARASLDDIALKHARTNTGENDHMSVKDLVGEKTGA